MLSAADLNSVISSLSRWESAGYVAAVFVAIGVAGEAIHEFTTRFNSFEWWRSNGGKACALLLIVALVAEVVIQIKVNSISGTQTAILDNEAATARERAAKLENETAILRHSASAREIKPEMRDQLKTRFAGHNIPSFLFCITNDFEALLYGQQLASALGNAGMPNLTMQELNGPPPLMPGVMAIGRNEDDDRFVVSTLRELGLVTISVTNAGIDIRVNDCHAPFIFVGTKPPLRGDSVCTTVPCDSK